MSNLPYCAIYDFELLPYALGDVLTWNVQTARRCEEAGRSKVDIYICHDPRQPANIYQRGLVVPENAGLFFNELFGAFGTHPLLGNTHLFSSRDELLERLRQVSAGDAVNESVLADYERVLAGREDEEALKKYFIRYIYSHEQLNAFAERHGRIPLLVASRGCEPDVQGLLSTVLAGKRIVLIHPRLRRLDAGLGGGHTHSRDSDFLEWLEFVRHAETLHPEVQFVVAGRLQEKPLELLRRPNVMSLRALGFGLGHELTLMLKADLFIGTSSGFAAMANFCELPYFITHMNAESCNAYAIKQGATKLPFAQPNQVLVYERETSEMLLRLLKEGLSLPLRGQAMAPIVRQTDACARTFQRQRREWLQPGATTYRFFLDDTYVDQETAFLVSPKVQEAFVQLEGGNAAQAHTIAARIATNFPRLARRLPELRDIADSVGRPMHRRLKHKLRSALLAISGNIIPMSLRGTLVHRVAHRMKERVSGL